MFEVRSPAWWFTVAALVVGLLVGGDAGGAADDTRTVAIGGMFLVVTVYVWGHHRRSLAEVRGMVTVAEQRILRERPLVDAQDVVNMLSTAIRPMAFAAGQLHRVDTPPVDLVDEWVAGVRMVHFDAGLVECDDPQSCRNPAHFFGQPVAEWPTPAAEDVRS